jgi:tRNA(Ile)-lysidine synthase TilS/MesJ
VKAIGLLSGGLDSTLAVRIVSELGIEVIAVKFTSPFCQCDSGGCCHAAEVARQMGLELKTFAKGDEYLDVVRQPKHGYGVGMNPCIDCRIFMFKKAKAYMEEIGAAFLFTGEVIGQRPMSQHRHAIELIERESGLEGKIVRPLSAQHMEPTEAERSGWIDRSKLLGINGRSRKPQLALAAAYGIEGFGCPAGGCLLTDQNFSAKLRDLFAHREKVGMRDIGLLKLGRHFRVGESKVVCARDEAECDALRRRAGESDLLLEAAECMGPTVLLEGAADEAAVRLAAEVAAAYSDASTPEVSVKCQSRASERVLRVARLAREALRPYQVIA